MAADPEAARAEGRATGLDAGMHAFPGLAPDERVSVRAWGPRLVLLERELAGEPGLPRDGALALCVDLRAFSLAEVLRGLHGAAKSGLLHFSHREYGKWVWMHRGEIVFAASNQRVDRLGHSLVRAGLITLEQLRDAERGLRRGERFGKALVERGWITPRALWAGLQRQVEEIVRSLFCHAAGTLYFWEGELYPDNVVRLALPTQRLIEEGARWREEMRRFVAALCDPRVGIEAVAARGSSLSGTERLVFDALAHESSLPGLCRRVGIDRPTAARVLQLLHRGGAVRIHCSTEDPDLTQRVRRPDPGRGLRALVEDATKALRALVAAIAAAEGDDSIDARFAGAVEEVAARFPGLLAGVEPGHGGALDPEILIARALALPPERQGDVREALGALSDYLEFEVKNHRRLPDADAVLRAVEPLRARLHA